MNEKECLVEVEFSIGSREYKVIRGIRPNIFEIWVDGKVQDQDAAAADQQKKLEESILKLNYKSFTQTMSFWICNVCSLHAVDIFKPQGHC